MSVSVEQAGALLDGIRQVLEEKCGLRMDDVADGSLVRALERAASKAEMGVETFAGKVRDGRDEGRALQYLLRQVTVGETTFFRHPDDLEWLKTTVFPELVARREADGSRRLRIWCAGCSTGEEAYTLAALALSAVPGEGWSIDILATDINDASLESARRAHYGAWSFRGVEPVTRERWFEPGPGDSWRPIAVLRSAVRFEYLNLRDPIYPAVFTGTTALDLVVCRNVFIYFHPARIVDALTRMHASLAEHGFALVGPSDLLQVALPPGTLKADQGQVHRLRRYRPADFEAEVETRPRSRPVPPRVRLDVRGPAPAGAPQVARQAAASVTQTQSIVALLREARHAEAIAASRRALQHDPMSVELNRLLAISAGAAGQDQVATEAWKRVLYLVPADPGAHLGFALALRHQGAAAEARTHFAVVVSLLEGVDSHATLPGPDAVSVGWARAACRSLAFPERRRP